MELTRDKIDEAKEILIGGKNKCFCPDADYKWAIDIIKEALLNGYDIVKVC